MLIHAAGESSPGDLPSRCYAIALACPDEQSLVALSERLTEAGIKHWQIVEDDPPWTGQLMALGIEPMVRSRISRLLSSLPLLR